MEQDENKNWKISKNLHVEHEQCANWIFFICNAINLFSHRVTEILFEKKFFKLKIDSPNSICEFVTVQTFENMIYLHILIMSVCFIFKIPINLSFIRFWLYVSICMCGVPVPLILFYFLHFRVIWLHVCVHYTTMSFHFVFDVPSSFFSNSLF